MSLNDDGKVIPFAVGRHNNGRVLAALDFADITATGAIKPTCANARIAIDKLEVVCEYDIFHDKYLVGGQAIGQYAGELSDNACLYLRKLIDKKFGFDPKATAMHEGLRATLPRKQFRPSY
jgi:hypothetical protein